MTHLQPLVNLETVHDRVSRGHQVSPEVEVVARDEGWLIVMLPLTGPESPQHALTRCRYVSSTIYHMFYPASMPTHRFG